MSETMKQISLLTIKNLDTFGRNITSPHVPFLNNYYQHYQMQDLGTLHSGPSMATRCLHASLTPIILQYRTYSVITSDK